MNPTRAARVHRMRALAYLIHTAQLELAQLRAQERRIAAGRNEILTAIAIPDDPNLTEPERIRLWAKQAGYDLAETGALPRDVIDDYHTALREHTKAVAS